MSARVLIIARACAAEPDGPYVEARLEHDSAPRYEDLLRVVNDVRAAASPIYPTREELA